MIHITHYKLQKHMSKNSASVVISYLSKTIASHQNREPTIHIRRGKEVERYIHVKAFDSDDAVCSIQAHINNDHFNINRSVWTDAINAIKRIVENEKEMAVL